MKTLGERLREERVRLGHNQTDFGELAGVQKLAQLNYEKGIRNPDTGYLAAIAKAGADILYIVTGVRAVGGLSNEEVALLDNYRNSPSAQQDIIRKTSAAFAQQQNCQVEGKQVASRKK